MIGGPQAVAPVEDRHRTGNTRQEKAFFHFRLPPAHHDNFFIFEEPAIAGAAISDTLASQLFFTWYSQLDRTRTSCNDQRISLHITIIRNHFEGTPGMVHAIG